MISLPPWAYGPFELLVHAEGHLRGGEDFDRRIALISFDNAIEVAITTFLTLHPIQRNGRSYTNADVDRWLSNYHTKLDFLESELTRRSLTWAIEKSYIIYAHAQRNEQYHGGHKGTPEKIVLGIIRDAAIWIFATLFEVSDAANLLEQAILDNAPPAPPTRDKNFDIAIDSKFGIVTVGEQKYYASELLFAADYWAYSDLGNRLCSCEDVVDEIDAEEAP